jgi:phosphatidate cytidylyltransferase
MGKRTIVSAVILPVLAFVIYASYWKGLLFFLFLLALSILAAREIHLLTGKIIVFKREVGSILWFVLPPVILLAAGFTNRFVNIHPGAMLYTAAGIMTGMVVISLTAMRPGEWPRRFAFLFANFVFVGVSCLLLLLLHEEQRGFMYIYFLMFSAWVSDAAAYIFGSRFGKRRGIVACSPNKSVEGYIGAFVTTMVMVNGFKLVFRAGFAPALLQVNILGFCIALTAPLGDLGESCFKRKAGVKDSSALFPELGGVLDIFDSVLFSVPLYYILVKSIL